MVFIFRYSFIIYVTFNNSSTSLFVQVSYLDVLEADVVIVSLNFLLNYKHSATMSSTAAFIATLTHRARKPGAQYFC